MTHRHANVLHIAGARKRRHAIGLEFDTCPDGTVVTGRATPEKCGGSPVVNPPASAPWTPPIKTNWPTYTPSGGGPGPSYSPPGGGGGSPGYNPPGIPMGPPTPPPMSPPIATPSGCAPACGICPEDIKRYVMPFIPDAGNTVTVTAGSTVRFVGKPQKLFKPDRLIIASTIAPYFDILNLIIANIPQSLSQGAVSAEMFSEVATYVMMSFDQAYPGIDIVIIAQNKSSVTQTFQAQLVGEAVG